MKHDQPRTHCLSAWGCPRELPSCAACGDVRSTRALALKGAGETCRALLSESFTPTERTINIDLRGARFEDHRCMPS